jgi:hypothetical protein
MWQDSLVPMVRALINDMDSTQFTDERVETSIVVAGVIVGNEYSFPTDYSFDIVDIDISPDPSADKVFVALVGLKAACILNTNQYQQGVQQGIRVRDGSSEVDTTSGFAGYKDILKLGPCGTYEKLVDQLRAQRSMMGGKAVLSPFTHESLPFGIQFLWNYSRNIDHREQ